jgi:hypothetical protein
MKGKMSIFGGAFDDFMKKDEGLALYEHFEADLRPDLFNNRALDREIGTSKRLRDGALYFAYRYDKTRPRSWLQFQSFLFTNPNTNRSVICHLVDWGPKDETMRAYDISPYAATLLNLRTDDEVIGVPL